MRRTTIALTIALHVLVLASCEHPTMLSVSQTALSFENSGGDQSVTITANKVWTASSNQGWLRVSPSSGEGNATLSISCEGNTTYDGRTGNITIVSEELTQTISVTQAEGLGLLISQSEYNLSNEAQTISVTVQANVQYTVEIDNTYKDWIKQESTKGLSSNDVKFAISKNESYDGREGKIIIRQANGSLSATVIVKQSQMNGLFAEKTEYEVSYEEQQLNIKVKSNVDYDVQIDDACKDWISRVQTKGLVESTVNLAIAKNEDVEREGKVLLKYGGVEEVIRIKQGEGYLEFEDAEFRAYCILYFDTNGDGNISYSEAIKVNKVEVSTDFVASLKGIEHMPNLDSLICWGYRKGLMESLDISNNKDLTYLDCHYNQLTTIDVSNNLCLQYLNCENNQLTTLDVTNNSVLSHLYCGGNHLSNLNVSNNKELFRLSCDGNQLTSLDVSSNVALIWLGCSRNSLYNLDVSNNVALEGLICGESPLSVLDVSKNKALKKLDCTNAQLTTLDVRDNTELVELYCSMNKLTSLNVDNNTLLQVLSCGQNQLSHLDVSKCTALFYVACSINQLTFLGVNNNPSLLYLFCSNNELKSLDLSSCVELQELWGHTNPFISLDVSNNKSLFSLWCYSCPSLTEIWLKTGQKIVDFRYDEDVATIKYK